MARLIITRSYAGAYGTNAQRIANILGARTPHFSLNTPADPTITSEATVDASTAAASLAVNGRRTILTSDTYGDLTLSGNDMEVVIQSGATIGTIMLEGVRIRVQAQYGQARLHTINNVMNSPWDAGASNRTDYMLDGLNIVSEATTQGANQNQFGMQRFAVINSYLDSVGFTAWVVGADEIINDSFWGKCYLNANRIASDQSTTQATMRYSDGFTRVVIVDSRLRNDDGAGGGRQHLRLHSTAHVSSGVWIDNVDFVGTNSQIRPSADAGATVAPEAMSSIRLNNTRWWLPNSPGQAVPTTGTGTATDPYPTDVEITNSTIYTDTGNAFATGGGAWTLTGNTVTSYSAPPAWSW